MLLKEDKKLESVCYINVENLIIKNFPLENLLRLSKVIDPTFLCYFYFILEIYHSFFETDFDSLKVNITRKLGSSAKDTYQTDGFTLLWLRN